MTASAQFVDVVLDVPTSALNTPFTYAVGAQTPALGARVRVPLGKRFVAGWVVGVRTETGGLHDVKAIDEILQETAIPSEAIALAQWLSRRYACTLREALGTVAPRGPRNNERFQFLREPLERDAQAAELYRRLGEKQFSALVAARLLRKAKLGLPLGATRQRLMRLANEGIVARVQVRPPGKPRARLGKLVAVLDDASKAKGSAARRLAEVLADAGGSLPLGDARKRAQASMATARTAAAAGVIRLHETAAKQRGGAGAPVTMALTPTSEQQEAIDRIDRAIVGEPVIALLEGITGSGKTLVYSRLIDRVRERGGRAIVLVPEIALTPQTAARFAEAFGASVGVLHSGLSASERVKVWRDATSGAIDVVVGARSAAFAPLPNLALIVVDEEHEPSYKQDVAPRYHAAAVAIERMKGVGGAVVLGSATPSLETYWSALQGRILHVRLTSRATAAPLPEVEIVDMTGQRGLLGKRAIGATLASKLEKCLARGDKALLFVNRRGYAGLLLCRSCGFAPHCRRCAVSLVVHAADRSMRCHVCGDAFQISAHCPKCKAADLRPFGFGTQRIEEEVKELFPSARVVRMDSDSTGALGAHERLLSDFASQGDILIGTQMIAKGLDYPSVTLVGAVAADQDLHRPDFRAAERTFALLTQVAGRAGRAGPGSSVVVQTYAPEHYAIALAAKHDYTAFAEKELEVRRELAYPPFGRIAYLVVAGLGQANVEEGARELATHVRAAARDVEVLGPAPDVLAKARGEFRMRIAIKSQTEEAMLEACAVAQQRRLPAGVRLTVIVDPR